jgi:hypothetical protein
MSDVAIQFMTAAGHGVKLHCFVPGCMQERLFEELLLYVCTCSVG